MKLKLDSSDVSDYLAETEIVDFNHPDIELLSNHFRRGMDYKKSAYEYVRDKVFHSADIRGTVVTFKASEVLHAHEGICFAKSNLLAALLRRNKIPVGFCYQLLRLSDADSPLVLHGLNAVYFAEYGCWVRLDARGNKAGVSAQFCGKADALAFLCRPELGEIDYETIYPTPVANVVAALTENKTFEDLWANLPQSPV